MEKVIIIAISIAFIAALIQFGLYKLTLKRFTIFFIPLICAVFVLSILIKYRNVSILSDEAAYFLYALFFGVPAVIGSLVGGIIVVKKNKKNSCWYNKEKVGSDQSEK